MDVPDWNRLRDPIGQAPGETRQPLTGAAPARLPGAQLPPWQWRTALASLFQTTFAFCFSMKEGMLLLSGLLLVTAFFWLYTLALQPWSPDAIAPSVLTIALLLANSALAGTAALWKSERGALALVLSFGAMLVVLLLDLATNSPASCASQDVIDDHPLGQLVSHLLWTADACLLMTILGWVTIAAAALSALYLWYMCICFWQQLRIEHEDARRVTRAIAALPTRRYRLPSTDGDGGGDGDDGDSCAICLDTFSDGEEVRMLPCMHEFCKPCIDQWIQRSGLTAACPLCKRLLLPSLPAVNARAPATSATAPATAETAAAAAPPLEEGGADVERGEAGDSTRSSSQRPAAPQVAQAELAAAADERASDSEGVAAEEEACASGVEEAAEAISVVEEAEGERSRPQHLCSPVGLHRPQAAADSASGGD